MELKYLWLASYNQISKHNINQLLNESHRKITSHLNMLSVSTELTYHSQSTLQNMPCHTL